MSAISRSIRTNPLTGSRFIGAPLVSAPLVSITSKYKYHRMKDMLRNALSGANGRDLFATPANNQAMSAGLFSANTDGGMGLGEGVFDMSRRSSMAPSNRQMMPGSRKQSLSGASGGMQIG